MKKRILCLSLILLVGLFPVAFAADEKVISTSGTCGIDGANVTWKLTAPGMDGEIGPDVEIQLTIVNRTGQPITKLSFEQIVTEYNEHYINFRTQEQLEDGEQITVNFTYNQNMLYRFKAYHLSDYSLFDCVPIDVTGNSATLVLNDNHVSNGITLTISGEGIMQDFSGFTQPWYDFSKNITEVIIENKVTSIGDNAFADCSGLRRITISDSVRSIGSDSFKNTALTSITIPKGVIRINDNFRSASFLTDIYVSNENPAFSSVDGVLLNKDGTSLIRCPIKKMFYTIPNTITKIERSAFSNCNIKQIVIPDSVQEIGLDAFSNCTNLTNATLSDSITDIPYLVFSGCSKLRKLKIPEGVKIIDSYAFEKCTSLKEIYLPKSLTNIFAAFKGCTSLENVYYAGTEADWNEIKIDIDNAELIYANKIYGPFKSPPSLAVEITADTVSVFAKDTVINTADLPEEYRPYNQWNQYQNTPLVYVAQYHADTGRMVAAFSLPYKIINGNLQYSIDASAGTYKVFLLNDNFQPIVSASELKIE